MESTPQNGLANSQNCCEYNSDQILQNKQDLY